MHILWDPLILIFLCICVKKGGKENYQLFLFLVEKLSSQSKYDPEEQFFMEKYIIALIFIEILKKIVLIGRALHNKC